jgi:hypothetical protein
MILYLPNMRNVVLVPISRSYQDVLNALTTYSLILPIKTILSVVMNNQPDVVLKKYSMTQA